MQAAATLLAAGIAFALAAPRPPVRAGARAVHVQLRRERLALPPDELRQQGTDIHAFLKIMGTKVGRVALFGIPLQQTWSYGNTGDFAPTYYLQTRRAALLLLVHRRLHRDGLPVAHAATEQARFDPMITGFNPADMYAADHIQRVLQTFPGVFSGIGEFTIHKEFVSAKIAGETASLTNPALDRILDFAGEAGLVVHPPQRRRHALPEARAGPLPGGAARRALPAAPEDRDHLGPLRPRAHRAAGEGPARDRRSRALRPARSPTSRSTSRGTRSRSTSWPRPRPLRPRRTSSTGTRTASCSARTRSRPPSRRST